MGHFLSDANKDYFIDMVSVQYLRPLTGTADDFFYIIKAITVEKTKEFIHLFSPHEIRDLIKSDTTFHSFIKKIAYAKEDALLEYLGYTLTSDGWKH